MEKSFFLFVFAFLKIENDDLPRQAQDERKQNSKKGVRCLHSGYRLHRHHDQQVQATLPARRGLRRPADAEQSVGLHGGEGQRLACASVRG
jgi:hypothetical protein